MDAAALGKVAAAYRRHYREVGRTVKGQHMARELAAAGSRQADKKVFKHRSGRKVAQVVRWALGEALS